MDGIEQDLSPSALMKVIKANILGTEKEEMGVAGQSIIRSAERARVAGWHYCAIHTGHEAMLTMPRKLVNLLLEII